MSVSLYLIFSSHYGQRAKVITHITKSCDVSSYIGKKMIKFFGTKWIGQCCVEAFCKIVMPGEHRPSREWHYGKETNKLKVGSVAVTNKKSLLSIGFACERKTLACRPTSVLDVYGLSRRANTVLFNSLEAKGRWELAQRRSGKKNVINLKWLVCLRVIIGAVIKNWGFFKTN